MSSTSSTRVDRLLGTALPLAVPRAWPSAVKYGVTRMPSARRTLNRVSESEVIIIRVIIIRIMEVSKCLPSDDVNLTMALFGEEVVIKQVEQEVSELLTLSLSLGAYNLLLKHAVCPCHSHDLLVIRRIDSKVKKFVSCYNLLHHFVITRSTV